MDTAAQETVFLLSVLSCPVQTAFQLVYSTATFSLALSKQQAAFSSSGKIIFYLVFNTEKWLSR